MPTVRYTGSGTYTLRDGPVFDAESREASVASATASRLVGRDDFEEVTTDGYDDEKTAGDSSDSETTDGYTCAGKGGDCSRSVDEQNGYCWQHES